jgi:hypothetical protein
MKFRLIKEGETNFSRFIIMTRIMLFLNLIQNKTILEKEKMEKLKFIFKCIHGNFNKSVLYPEFDYFFED